MISFITVNYNGVADTLALIDSLHRHVKSVPYEVIVVDNGSANDEAATIRAAHPDVTVIAAGRNLGFAGGNNVGIRAAKGEYLLLINNDTYVEEDHFDALLTYMNAHPRVGGITPLLCHATCPPVVQWAGYTPLTAVTLRNSAIGQGDTPARHTESKETPFLHGAAMLLRRETVERVGLMPTVYFLYYEEYDWCCAMRRAGYELAFVPQQTIFHRESQATGQGSPLKAYYLTRGRLLFARRNRHGLTRIVSCLYQLLVVLPRNILCNITRPAHLGAYLHGAAAGCLDSTHSTPNTLHPTPCSGSCS